MILTQNKLNNIIFIGYQFFYTICVEPLIKRSGVNKHQNLNYIIHFVCHEPLIHFSDLFIMLTSSIYHLK